MSKPGYQVAALEMVGLIIHGCKKMKWRKSAENANYHHHHRLKTEDMSHLYKYDYIYIHSILCYSIVIYIFTNKYVCHCQSVP